MKNSFRNYAHLPHFNNTINNTNIPYLTSRMQTEPK